MTHKWWEFLTENQKMRGVFLLSATTQPTFNENGFTILNNFITHDGDSHFLHARITTPDTFCTQSFQHLHTSFLDTFSKQRQHSTSAEPFWSPIINSGDSAVDKAEAANMNSWFTSTNMLPIEKLEQSRE